LSSRFSIARLDDASSGGLRRSPRYSRRVIGAFQVRVTIAFQPRFVPLDTDLGSHEHSLATRLHIASGHMGPHGNIVPQAVHNPFSMPLPIERLQANIPALP